MSAFRQRRVAVQAPLGFAAGIPLYLTGRTLASWLELEGVDVETIGLFALVSLPYSLKVLWAPLLDRYRLPWLGRRRGWLVPSLLAGAALIVVLGHVDPRGAPGTLAAVAVAVAFVSASHDVVLDAYRTDVLDPETRGPGAAAYVSGYRLALIVTGSGALILAEYVSWPVIYAMMAALLAIGLAGVAVAPPAPEAAPPPDLRTAVWKPLVQFFSRRAAGLALAVVMSYRLGDAVADQLIGPFLLGRYSPAVVGTVQNLVGMGATIVGSLIGGALLGRIGLRRALLMFGIAQAAANAGYLAIALGVDGHAMLIVGVVVDNLCNGLGIAAFVALIMTLCDRRFSATQYALLTSAASLLGRLIGAGSGFVVNQLGWGGFFALTIALAIPALSLLPRLDTSITDPTA